MGRIRLACVDSLLGEGTLPEKAELLRKWGFEGVTVYRTLEECGPGFAEELKAVRSAGIEPCEFAFIDECFGNLVSDDPEKKAKNIAMVKRAVDICGEAGALTEIEYECSHRRDMPSYNNNSYPMPPENKQAEFTGVLGEIADYAAPKGVTVLVEAVNRYEANYVNLQSHALEFIKRAGRPNTGLLCDLFHMSLDEEDLASVIRNCAGYVRHVHIGDTNRRLPGRGYLDWPGIVRALKEIDFDGYMSFECTVMGDPAVELPEAVAYMRTLIDRT